MKAFVLPGVVGTVAVGLLLAGCGVRIDPASRAEASADQALLVSVAAHVGRAWTPLKPPTRLSCESAASWNAAPAPSALALVTQVTDYLSSAGWTVEASPAVTGDSAYASLSQNQSQSQFQVLYTAHQLHLDVLDACASSFPPRVR